MRIGPLTIALCLNSVASAAPGSNATTVAEVVYVETTLDTDADGRPDRIYAEVTRPTGGQGLPTIFTISPYSTGGDDSVPNHGVDVSTLPQDSGSADLPLGTTTKPRLWFDFNSVVSQSEALDRGYATIAADSLGTGSSTGCPTVGDQSETLAAKAVIDWLNGRARAFGANGQEVLATWANGSVGMTGVSYNGTLPNMVATTGVDGLKAIVPVSAISNWYDYYRANGLVVGPGGYIGEDADVLGKFIVRSGACAAEMTRITQAMGREHGDFSPFWQAREYVSKASNVRAAVFIMHGQSDWNVKQRHAIQWWEALQGHVPLRLWLHKGAHGLPSRADTSEQTFAWFDHYVKGVANAVEDQPSIEVESPTGEWTAQAAWPHETTTRQRFYLNAGHRLAATPAPPSVETLVDTGRTTRLDSLLTSPSATNSARLAFVTPPLAAAQMVSGTTHVQLSLAVLNHHAANVVVALVEYDSAGRARIVTRGWMDPQNHADLTQGEPLETGRYYSVSFNLEPKQYTFAQGSRIGVVVASTDYDYTLRPNAGTQISAAEGEGSFVEVNLSNN